MAVAFPYEVYGVRIGAAAPIFALISPVRAVLVLVGQDTPPLGRNVADALREFGCAPEDVQDIILVESPAPDGHEDGQKEGPKAMAPFADAYIHRLTAPRDVLAGISAITGADGHLTLRVRTRAGQMPLPSDGAIPSGATVRLD
jgi:hypothetical protein